MWWRRTIIFCWCIITTLSDDRKTCKIEEHPKSRTFDTLSQYQANKNSFNPDNGSYIGNSISFLFDRVESLEKNDFLTFTSEYVTEMTLSHKNIQKVDDGAFISLYCLHFLDLSYNKISNLTQGMFKDLVNLKTLYLNGNLLNFIPNFVFIELKNIVTMNLSDNEINKAEEFGLYNISTLEKLYMAHNLNLKTVFHHDFFNDLTNLIELDLHGNELAMINISNFKNLKKLQKLDLSGNELTLFDMTTESFELPDLTFLNISNDYLFDLDVSGLRKHFPNRLFTLDINKNPFYCANLAVLLKKIHLKGILVSPGRSTNATRHIDHIICDSENETLDALYKEDIIFKKDKVNKINTKLKEDTFSGGVKGVIIGLSCIVSALCIFFTIDYVLGTGVLRRISRRLPVWRRSRSLTLLTDEYICLDRT